MHSPLSHPTLGVPSYFSSDCARLRAGALEMDEVEPLDCFWSLLGSKGSSVQLEKEDLGESLGRAWVSRGEKRKTVGGLIKAKHMIC